MMCASLLDKARPSSAAWRVDMLDVGNVHDLAGFESRFARRATSVGFLSRSARSPSPQRPKSACAQIEIRKPIQLRALVQSSREKYLASVFQKFVIWSRHPASLQRGASRSSRTLGRDAVDAAASGAIVIAGRASLVSGTKRATTNGADADGKSVWS
jgi:hypothetical protein